MSNMRKFLSQNSLQGKPHQIKLVQFADVSTIQTLVEVPTPNGAKQQDPPLLKLESSKHYGLDIGDNSIVAGKQFKTLRGSKLYDLSIDDDPEFDKYATVPMLVLEGISKRQGLPTSAMQSEISGAARNAAFVGVGAIVGYVLKYGNTFLIQRSLGAASFGVYSIALSVVTLVLGIVTLGLDDAMIRYVAIYRSKRQINLLQGLMIFCTVMVGVTGMLGAAFVFRSAPFLAALKHTPHLAALLWIMAPMVPLSCLLAVWNGGLQGAKEFKRRVLLQRIFVPVLTFLLLLGSLLFFPDNVTVVAVVTLVSTTVNTVFCLYFFYRTIWHTFKPVTKAYAVREWLGFAVPNFLTTIIDTVLDSVDTLLLTFFAVSDIAIGQYNAAIKISGFIAMPLASLNTMFAPTIAELHSKGEEQKLEVMFKIVTKWAIIFSLPIFWISTLFSASLLALSGNSFISAWPLLIVFAVGGLINVGTGSVGYMLLMTGHQKLSFLNALTAIVVNIVFGIILTPHFGAMGTAISTGLAASTVNLMRLLQVRLLLKMQPYQWTMLKPMGAGLISALVTGSLLYLVSLTHWSFRLFHTHLSIGLALIPLFLAMYVCLLALFKTSPEDKIVLDALRKKLKLSSKRGKK